jgi:hypothetical protein
MLHPYKYYLSVVAVVVVLAELREVRTAEALRAAVVVVELNF